MLGKEYERGAAASTFAERNRSEMRYDCGISGGRPNPTKKQRDEQRPRIRLWESTTEVTLLNREFFVQRRRPNATQEAKQCLLMAHV